MLNVHYSQSNPFNKENSEANELRANSEYLIENKTAESANLNATVHCKQQACLFLNATK